MYLPTKKSEAVKLRREGYSYSFISQKTGVAKSTLSLWLKGVPFTPNASALESIINGQKLSIQTKRVDRANSLLRAHDFAKTNIQEMSERDVFMLGIGIYVGEGSKAGNLTRIVNSDPRIIKFSMLWLKKCFGLSDSNFKIRIHLYPDTDEVTAVTFWSKELSLPRESFHSCYVDRRTNKKTKKQNILPFGTAHMSVVSNGDKNLGVLLHRKILASIDRVLSA
jgi:transcriptional regulator with XRE-family HTH domain